MPRLALELVQMPPQLQEEGRSAFALHDGRQLKLYAWLKPSEYEHFSKLSDEELSRTWLASIQVREDLVAANAESCVSTPEGACTSESVSVAI